MKLIGIRRFEMFKRKLRSHAAAETAVILFMAGSFLLFSASVKAQPTATATSSPIPTPDKIQVRVSVMAPQIVSDTFGKRIAQNFVAIQVTIANHDKDYQYLINDVSLWMQATKVFTPPLAPPPNVTPTPSTDFFFSSAELSLLRGVAEKGQGQDTRNRILRLFRGVGTIAAGLIGVTSFGPSYPKSVAVFNGPVINAFSEAFPDYTINQMNRLSDSAYSANTLIPAKHSKVMVAFIPQAMFLSKKQRKLFWDDPTALYPDHASGACGTSKIPPCVDFRRVRAVVDGDFITELTNVPPVITTAQFVDSEMQKFEDAKPVVKGTIIGRFLTGISISVISPDQKGISGSLDGTPTADRLNFTIKSDKPVPPGTRLDFEVSNLQGSDRYTKELSYMPDPPTLDDIPPPKNSARQGSSVILTLTGTNFIPGKGNTTALVSGEDVDVSDPFEVTGTSLKVTFKIGANAAVGDRQLTVKNANRESAPVTFTITAAGNQ